MKWGFAADDHPLCSRLIYGPSRGYRKIGTRYARAFSRCMGPFAIRIGVKIVPYATVRRRKEMHFQGSRRRRTISSFGTCTREVGAPLLVCVVRLWWYGADIEGIRRARHSSTIVVGVVLLVVKRVFLVVKSCFWTMRRSCLRHTAVEDDVACVEVMSCAISLSL